MRRKALFRWSLCLGTMLAALLAAGGLLVKLGQAASLPAGNLDNIEALTLNPGLTSNGFFEEEHSVITILASDENSVTLDFTLPYFEVKEHTQDGQLCNTIQVSGLSVSSLQDQFQLPTVGTLVGIPNGASVNLEVITSESESLNEQFSICSLEPLQERPLLPGEPNFVKTLPLVMNRRYNSRIEEKAAVKVTNIGYLRNQNVAQIVFSPFKFDALTGKIRYYQHLIVRVTFSKPGKLVQDDTSRIGMRRSPFDALLQQQVINYAQAQRWQQVAEEPQQQSNTEHRITRPRYKLEVSQEGIYQLTYSDLLTAGIDPNDINPLTFQLWNQDQQVAIYVSGEQDGSFDQEDTISFYGQELNTRFTDKNIYWLSWGEAPGLRMGSNDGAPVGTLPVPSYFTETKHLERDMIYLGNYPSGDPPDYWYWTGLSASSPGAEKTFQFTIPLSTNAPTTARIRGFLRGYAANPEHHTQIFINGHLVDDAIWEPNASYLFEQEIPVAFLVDGTNTIRIVCPLDNGITLDVIVINWFEIQFPSLFLAQDNRLFFTGMGGDPYEIRMTGFTNSNLEAYDLRSPLNPVRVQNLDVQSDASGFAAKLHVEGPSGRYLVQSIAQRLKPERIWLDVPSNLRSLDNSADYIVISHHDFITAMVPLIAQRQAQGMRTALIDVDDIYDEFRDGIFDPGAIRDFLQYAYESWSPPAPAYVLLVGDGHYDYKDLLGKGDPIYIPPYMAFVDPWIGETATDNRYVTVHGNDILPDLFIGRLPVRTISEANSIVQKILQYENTSVQVDGWNTKLTFVADNSDSAGYFNILSDSVISTSLPPPYTAQRIYYLITHSTATEVRTSIVEQLDEGRLLLNYTGHSAMQFWASEKLFRFDELNLLQNQGKYPLFVSMTCLDGSFHYPAGPGENPSSLAETAVRLPQTGAIASWSPSGFGVATGHDFLNKGLFNALFSEDITALGPATTLAKLNLYSNTASYRDLIDTYILFGDPAMHLATLPADVGIQLDASPDHTLLPGETITYTLTVSNAGPAAAHHIEIEDALAPALLNPQVQTSGVALELVPGSRLVWEAGELLPGAVGRLTVTATIDPAFTGVISNSAAIRTSTRETYWANNRTPAVSHLVQAADLWLTKSAPIDLQPGQPITYSLRYGNLGNLIAAGVVISDDMPALVQAVSVTWSGPPITPTIASSLSWQVADLAPGQTGVVTISAVISPGFAGILTNQAEIATESIEVRLDNNASGPVNTGLALPNLNIHKTGPSLTLSGERLTYTLHYANAGSETAPGVVIRELLPEPLYDVQVQASIAITVESSGSWRFLLGDLAPGAQGAITLTARTPLSYTGMLQNQATISSTMLEAHPEDNASEVIETFAGSPDLQITKTGPAWANPGQEVEYVITYANQGTVTATQVTIQDLLPGELISPTLEYDHAQIQLLPGDDLTWLAPVLAPGERGAISVQAKVAGDARGSFENQVVIDSLLSEWNLTNNQSGVVTNLRRRVLLPVVLRAP